MVRASFAVALATLLLAAPAQAFQTCDHSGATVTATFGSETTGTLVQVGTAIHTEDGQCDGATTANTDTIEVVGDESDAERLTISLAGGTFLGGATNEPGSSDEVEIEVDLKSGFGSPDVSIVGSGGVDDVTIGEQGTEPDLTSAANLNANETDGIDADVTFSQREELDVAAGGGGDILGGGGGDGTGARTTSYRLRGEGGSDDLTNTDRVTPGPGNDTVRFPVDGLGVVEYADVPVGIAVTLQDGTGGVWGGATNDGQGGADAYVGVPDYVLGSAHADTFNGSIHDDGFIGLAGGDVVNGGAGDDELDGNDGPDVLHGGPDEDELYAGEHDDEVHGDGGNDIVDGGNGTDDEFGGEGDDRHRQSGVNQVHGEETEPNGADDVSGGAGTDTLEYADPGIPSFGYGFAGRTAPVFVDLDDVADDGGVGEGDNARTDIENVVGSVANDTLVGDGDANALWGFDGADTLRGAGGADTLRGVGSRGGWGPTIEEEIADEGDDIDGGPGADTVDADEGDDRIEAREGTADVLDCGPGTDTGRADAIDTVHANCEFPLPVELPVDPPVQTPVDPGPPPVDPPADPPVQPPVTPQPAPKVSTLLSLPSTRRCASRRKFTVKVRREIRGSVKRVQIFINGRKVRTVTGRRIALPIDLRGLPKGRVRVKLRVELKDGRVATDTRRYRTCATRKRSGRWGPS